MHRILIVLTLLCTVALPLAAEEIILKDGTKIVGHMTAINGDKIEVETAYGKMSVKRGDIMSISFPENNSEPGTTTAPPKEMPTIDESLDGTQYTNKTGKFSLTVPTEWKINPSLRRTGDAMAALSSLDNMRYLMVVQETYPASIESYEGLIEIQAKSNLQDYEKLSASPATIDNKPSILLSYRGNLPKANNLPVQFLSAIIPSANGFYRITTWCVEPLFNESQPLFEKIITSFHDTDNSSAPPPGSKP